MHRAEGLRHWPIQPPAAAGHARAAFHPSGLCLIDGELATVSDRVTFDDVYALRIVDGIARCETLIRLTGIEGLPAGHDLEGVDARPGQLVLVEEDEDRVVLIDLATRRATSARALDWTALGEAAGLDLEQGAPNAGLEGVAFVPGGVVAAKERQGRALVLLPRDGSQRAVAIPGGGAEQRSDAWAGRDWTVHADVAGLHAEGSTLYVLVRNGWQVLAVDLPTRRVLAVLEFPAVDRQLYTLAKPYGLAEGLVLTDEHVWLVLDNNDEARRAASDDRRGTLVRMDRPAGF